MKLLLLTRSLNTGGAERQFVNLAGALTERGVEVHVATFYGGGQLEHELAETNSVRLHRLGKRGRWDLVRFGSGLRVLLNRYGFDVVYSLLPSPNLAALLGRTMRRRPRVVWGIRGTEKDYSQYPSIMRWTERFHLQLVTLADHVIVNSRAALAAWRQHGIPDSKLSHIPNGIHIAKFDASSEAREQSRRELGLPEGSVLIGLVARIDPMKDHRTFLESAARLRRRHPAVQFMCIGGTPPGMEPYAEELRRHSAALYLNGVVHWLGGRSDVPRRMAGMDVLTLSSSFGEGFPNVIGEAMATGVPCVVTDVGDSAYVVGEAGTVVPPRDPDALAAAWECTLTMSPDEREKLCSSARSRVESLFSVGRMADKTLKVLERVTSRSRERR